MKRLSFLLGCLAVASAAQRDIPMFSPPTSAMRSAKPAASSGSASSSPTKRSPGQFSSPDKYYSSGFATVDGPALPQVAPRPQHSAGFASPPAAPAPPSSPAVYSPYPQPQPPSSPARTPFAAPHEAVSSAYASFSAPEQAPYYQEQAAPAPHPVQPESAPAPPAKPLRFSSYSSLSSGYSPAGNPYQTAPSAYYEQAAQSAAYQQQQAALQAAAYQQQQQQAAQVQAQQQAVYQSAYSADAAYHQQVTAHQQYQAQQAQAQAQAQAQVQAQAQAQAQAQYQQQYQQQQYAAQAQQPVYQPATIQAPIPQAAQPLPMQPFPQQQQQPVVPQQPRYPSQADYDRTAYPSPAVQTRPQGYGAGEPVRTQVPQQPRVSQSSYPVYGPSAGERYTSLGSQSSSDAHVSNGEYHQEERYAEKEASYDGYSEQREQYVQQPDMRPRLPPSPQPNLSERIAATALIGRMIEDEYIGANPVPVPVPVPGPASYIPAPVQRPLAAVRTGVHHPSTPRPAPPPPPSAPRTPPAGLTPAVMRTTPSSIEPVPAPQPRPAPAPLPAAQVPVIHPPPSRSTDVAPVPAPRPLNRLGAAITQTPIPLPVQAPVPAPQPLPAPQPRAPAPPAMEVHQPAIAPPTFPVLTAVPMEPVVTLPVYPEPIPIHPPPTVTDEPNLAYEINYCDKREFPDDLLATYGLARLAYFVYNTSCSQHFYQCSIGKTFVLHCSSEAESFDRSTTNCNFRSDIRYCPEYDHVKHCSVRDTCSDLEYACCSLPQQCLPLTRRCDGHADCSDGDDENNCPSCARDEFACVKSGACIPAEKRCDGVADDCGDGSNLDEIGCSKNSTCIGKFTCSKSIGGPSCIEWEQHCDGQTDCSSGEDEASCKMTDTKQYLQCENQKQTVRKEQWCDGSAHCDDGSDEKYCY